MSYHRATGFRGLGDAATAAREVQIGGSVAASGATAILGSIAASGGSVLGLTGAALTAAIPIVGAALAGATTIIQMLVANSGCGQTCIVTSQWANQAAAALQKVLDGYFALPAPRTDAQKALALANFDTIWQTLQQQCGQPGTGNAGVRCISDRQAGACTWRQKYAPVYPGEPNIGECWNWFNGYRDPIAADLTIPDSVAQTPVSSGDPLGSFFTSGGAASASGVPSWVPLAALAGLVIVAVNL